MRLEIYFEICCSYLNCVVFFASITSIIIDKVLGEERLHL